MKLRAVLRSGVNLMDAFETVRMTRQVHSSQPGVVLVLRAKGGYLKSHYPT